MGSRLAVMDLAAHERRGFDVVRAVRRTRLGSMPAKAVLVMLGECSNAEGVSFPSRERIACESDVDLRTVHRVVQCLRAIGLVEVVKFTQEERRATGRLHGEEFRLNLVMLGSDLAGVLAEEWARVHGKQPKPSPQSVPGTSCEGVDSAVPGTLFTVPGTLPPDPLLGRTTIEPPIPPNPPEGNTPNAQEPHRNEAAEEAWRQVQFQLTRQVNVQSFNTWLKPTRGVAMCDGVLQVRVPSTQFSHLAERYGGEVKRAIAALGLPVRDVQFVAPEDAPAVACEPVPVPGLRPAKRQAWQPRGRYHARPFAVN